MDFKILNRDFPLSFSSLSIDSLLTPLQKKILAIAFIAIGVVSLAIVAIRKYRAIKPTKKTNELPLPTENTRSSEDSKPVVSTVTSESSTEAFTKTILTTKMFDMWGKPVEYFARAKPNKDFCFSLIKEEKGVVLATVVCRVETENDLFGYKEKGYLKIHAMFPNPELNYDSVRYGSNSSQVRNAIHEVAIRLSFQLGYGGRVKVRGGYEEEPFHYKCGFRYVPRLEDFRYAQHTPFYAKQMFTLCKGYFLAYQKGEEIAEIQQNIEAFIEETDKKVIEDNIHYLLGNLLDLKAEKFHKGILKAVEYCSKNRSDLGDAFLKKANGYLIIKESGKSTAKMREQITDFIKKSEIRIPVGYNFTLTLTLTELLHNGYSSRGLEKPNNFHDLLFYGYCADATSSLERAIQDNQKFDCNQEMMLSEAVIEKWRQQIKKEEEEGKSVVIHTVEK